jgi:hypothetical protein
MSGQVSWTMRVFGVPCSESITERGVELKIGLHPRLAADLVRFQTRHQPDAPQPP